MLYDNWISMEMVYMQIILHNNNYLSYFICHVVGNKYFKIDGTNWSATN